MSATASNVTNLLMSLNAPPVPSSTSPHTSAPHPAERDHEHDFGSFGEYDDTHTERAAAGVECEFNGVQQFVQLDVKRGHVDLGVHTLQQQQHLLGVDDGDERVVAELAQPRQQGIPGSCPHADACERQV
ncbi:hypothetical protein BD309DRAFT_1020228 [Dichomitus squalens]|nr:hypothetical protein BD309DRAFT_1020228 [Dichomitus squalens]